MYPPKEILVGQIVDPSKSTVEIQGWTALHRRSSDDLFDCARYIHDPELRALFMGAGYIYLEKFGEAIAHLTSVRLRKFQPWIEYYRAIAFYGLKKYIKEPDDIFKIRDGTPEGEGFYCQIKAFMVGATDNFGTSRKLLLESSKHFLRALPRYDIWAARSLFAGANLVFESGEDFEDCYNLFIQIEWDKLTHEHFETLRAIAKTYWLRGDIDLARAMFSHAENVVANIPHETFRVLADLSLFAESIGEKNWSQHLIERANHAVKDCPSSDFGKPSLMIIRNDPSVQRLSTSHGTWWDAYQHYVRGVTIMKELPGEAIVAFTKAYDMFYSYGFGYRTSLVAGKLYEITGKANWKQRCKDAALKYGPRSILLKMVSNDALPLTERERQVFEHLRSGAHQREIADKLALSYGTIRKVSSSIYSKLNLHSQNELRAKYSAKYGT